jgi:AraC-like DNA-binding protein
MQLHKSFRLSPYDKRCILKALEYIEIHYRDRLSAERVSLEINISKQKLQAGIQELTGLTLHHYILKVRVEKAKQLLEDTNEPVKYIAAAIGFKRPSHFIFTFKEFTSLTPIEYRLQNAG